MVKPADKRKIVQYLITKHKFSQCRACRLTNLHRKTYNYRTKKKNDDDLNNHIVDIANKRKRFGYRRIHLMLKKEGFTVNHKKVYRIYKEHNLSLRRKRTNKIKRSEINSMPTPMFTNDQWAMDFMSDSMFNGRKFRMLNIIDIATRECLTIDVDTSIKGKRVTRTLDKLVFLRGKPKSIIMDNGSEFTSKILQNWAAKRDIKLSFIQPGKPFQNAFIESFNGKFRDECLNENWFINLKQAKSLIENWRMDYNSHRPHSSLGGLTPLERKQMIQNTKLKTGT